MPSVDLICPACKMIMQGVVDICDPDLPIAGSIRCSWCEKRWIIRGKFSIILDITEDVS